MPIKAATRELTWDVLDNSSNAFLCGMWGIDLCGPPLALVPWYTAKEQCAEIPNYVGAMQMVQLNSFY